MTSKRKRITVDYLVIGSGLAGLTAALEAAPYGKVLVVTKAGAEDCNTRYAQGGISCVTLADDSFDAHVRDTLVAGAGLCKPDVVRTIVEAAPERIRRIQEWGVHFTLQKEVEPEKAQQGGGEAYHLGREGGHSARRILHAGDITGREVSDVLLARCRENPNITILENHLAVDLISTRHIEWQGDNACLGAYVIDTTTNEIDTIIAKFTFLATGGAGKVYL